MNGRLIIELPTSLSASIISEWLNVKDRLMLDTAHCQVSVREEFVQLNRIPELSVKSLVHDRALLTNQALVTWALLRKVYVEKLSVESEGNLDLYNAYLQKSGSRVFVIRLHYCTTGRLAQSIATCRNLLVLKVHYFKLSAFLRRVFVSCERLREFCAHSCISRRTDPDPSEPPLTSADLDTLVCDNLKYLELECDVDLVAAFLRMAVAVEVVVLSPEYVPLNNIPESMSLTASTLSLTRAAVDERLVNFAARGKRIENISLRQCYIADGAIGCFCKFPHLRALDLTCTAFNSGNAEDCLKALVECCGDKLTELLLSCGDPGLSLTSVLQVLPSFTQLASFCLRLQDDDPLVWDLSSFSRLTKLSLSYRGANNAELIGHLAEHCHNNIQELSLTLSRRRVVLSNLVFHRLDTLVSTCMNLRNLNLADFATNYVLFTEEDKDRWQNLRPGLTIGRKRDHRLNVFDKYECSGAW